MAYSHSKVMLFQQCPLKFRFQHIDKYPQEFETTADLVLGNAVHHTLEKLYNRINNFKLPSFEEILKEYYSFWDEKEMEMKEKGESILIKNMDDTFEDYKNRGHMYLKNYYDKHYPFEDIKVIDTEANISFSLDDDITFTGFIDRLDKTGDNTFVINDYKTNKRIPTEDKEENTDQLTIYGKGIIEKYGKYFDKLKARIYYLHFDIEDEWEITDSLLEEVSEKYRGIIRDIQQKTQMYKEGDNKAFQPNKSALCRWCEFKSMCPLFSHSYMDDEFVSELSEKSIKSLVDEFGHKNEEKKRLDKELNELKNIFIEYIESKDEDIERLYGNSYNIKIKENVYYKYPEKEKFLQRLKERGELEQVSDISFQKVKKVLDEGKIDFEQYKDLLEKKKSYTPYVSRRKGG